MRRLFLFGVLSVVFAACNCGKKPAAPALLKEGEPCENDERCETGLCDAAPGFMPVCVRRCGDGCFTTEVCVQLTPNRFACQSDQRKLCAPCVADSDCPYPSDHCLVVNGEHVCGRDCAFDQNCPTGYRCVNGQGVDGLPKVQQCVPTNASCACLARGDFMQPCQTTNSFGTCLGTKECDLVSNTVVCNAATPAAETCNGKDDNCNGDTDEGGMTAMCGVGACARTVNACVDGGIAMCTPGTPTAETCNGIDDNCDGMTDESFDLTTDRANCGMCGHACSLPHATSNCSGSTCHVATCDTGWDNCNRMDPDGCEANVTGDPNNCGGCNQSCTRPHSTATCVNSMCQFACAPGFVDLNGDPADGCEYACTFMSSTDIPDVNFVDANCDGIDGELMNGIFVAPTPVGNDTAAGTRAAPVATIPQAMTLASTLGKRDIYVAEGTYNGPLDLLGVNGLNIAGAYNVTTWQRSLLQTTILNGGNPVLRIDGSTNLLVQGFRLQGSNGAGATPTAYGAKVNESTGVKLEALDVRAGNGLAGAAGASQVGTANPGGGGTNAATSCYNDPRTDTNHLIGCNFFYDICTGPPAGGQGGAGCGGANGGQGGAPSLYNPSGTSTGQAGQPGLVSGGTAGTGVPAGVIPLAGSIYFGGNGANGSNGGNGTAAGAGTFNNTGFVLASAANGSTGGNGKGGGGGGGGAGGLGPPISLYAGITCYAYGTAGGGGGGGGCGGAAGSAGTSGGASIGLFLFNAQVTGTNVVIRTGNGGSGGAGGSGQTGGGGGPAGGSPYDTEQGQATPGGGGGQGGAGGTGGHGGGGAGGPVYGVAKNSGSMWVPTGGSTMLGTPGAGGTSPGNAGPMGASGVVTTF
ncbi:MAG: MopE-related protein [Myxococcaceae bacterium]